MATSTSSRSPFACATISPNGPATNEQPQNLILPSRPTRFTEALVRALDGLGARPDGNRWVVDLATLWRLGKEWYGDRLHDDHRRRTPEEATALFAELGLKGPFWDMGAADGGLDPR